MLSPENYIRQRARTLPLYECVINDDWEESGVGNLIVSRKHSNGNLTMGMFLVDLKCLGVKDALYRQNMYEHEYREIISEAGKTLNMVTIPYPLAHNIVYAGIEFAEEFGFQPHKSFNVAQYILEEDSDDIELIDIECGIEGKPAYVRGPLDTDLKQARVIAQLEKTAGPGNYIFIDDDDEFEDGEDDSAAETIIIAPALFLNDQSALSGFVEILPLGIQEGRQGVPSIRCISKFELGDDLL